LENKELKKHIESILFVAEQEVNLSEFEQMLNKSTDEKIKKKTIAAALTELEEQYKDDIYSFHLVPISDGYRLFTKEAYHKTVSHYIGLKSKKRLSKAAMESLSIIAYKQPVTRVEIDTIRGVSSEYSLQKLLEREMIEITGRAETVGKPLLYATSKKFMDFFGLKSIKDLPKLEEVIPQHNQIGGETEKESTEKDIIQSRIEQVKKDQQAIQIAEAVEGSEAEPSSPTQGADGDAPK